MYSISFKKYLYKEDNKVKSFENLDKAAYKKALRWFKDSFLYDCIEALQSNGGHKKVYDNNAYLYDCIEALQSNGGHKKVYDNNAYSFLFKDLEPDVEMFEFILSDKNRLFYYIGDNYIIYIRLFASAHLEVSKNKR